MNDTRWVLFDLGRVIVPFDHTRVAAGLAARWLPTGTSEAEAARWRAWCHEFIYGEAQGPSRNSALDRGCTPGGAAYVLEDLRKELCECTGQSISLAELAGIWNSIFDAPLPASLSLMEALRDEGLRVGICSNTNGEHWEWCIARAPALRRVPHALFLSFEMHANKPERAYFERVLAATGAAPADHILLDDVEVNVAGAAAAGMGAVLIEPPLVPASVRRALAAHWPAFASRRDS